VAVDVRAHLDLLDLDDLLVLARFGRFLLVGVFQLAEIEDLDDRRFGIGRDFDEVQARLFGGEQCIIDGNVPAVAAVGIDELYARDSDVAIGARAVFCGRRCLEWSANGRVLLELLTMSASPERRPGAYVGRARALSIA
jgi:hypothetical protein